MLALAGIPLGERFTFLDPNPGAPAAAVGDLVVGTYDDPTGLDALAEACDVVTYEFENVPAASVERLTDAGVEVHPGPVPLATAQDRLAEKDLFDRTGLAVPRTSTVDSLDDLRAALDRVGDPLVLKTRGGGYDGKGQAIVRAGDDLGAVLAALGGSRLIAEELVPFDRELSLLAARGRDGSVVVYPLVGNVHVDGILRVSRAPAPGVSDDLQRRAEERARSLLNELDYVGVLAVELFEVDGKLLGNEMAPRVHNSGHWTIEGAATSQFENHVRAVMGHPLGSAEPLGHSAMLNLIGGVPDLGELFHLGAHVHLYDKSPRPGRKLGHVTLVDDDPGRLTDRTEHALELIAASEE